MFKKETKKIVILGQCLSKSNQYKIGVIGGNNTKLRAIMYKSKEMKQWETEFALQLLEYSNPRINGQFHLGLIVYFKSKRSDLDNCFKGILDCLQKNCWIKNDRDCIKITAQKSVSKMNPRIEFVLKYN